jgi:hypothetical protein
VLHVHLSVLGTDYVFTLPLDLRKCEGSRKVEKGKKDYSFPRFA